MSYLVLARKYRPQTFEDLAGQDHVGRTLASAITTGRIAHAFLFTGVRGVGKTTSARLLAKCLNCVGTDGQRKAPTPTPCNVCAPCQEITAGYDLDVQEIDGASCNGVDEVRRLQEGVSFRPARDRFKVYIVDEVHMLSTAAWNAFLKTLEEPPPHAKFIFATTEVHKVPVTILSRCQRYDFKLIPTQTIAKRIDQVLLQERIQADGVAVQVIAREAAGSMRDAMSLLDQVIAFSGTTLTGEDVASVLGVADRSVLHDLALSLVNGNAGKCLAVVDRVAEQGFDLAHVAKDLLGHLRNLVVAKVCAGASPETPALRELLDLADEEMSDVVDLAARAETDDLVRLFQGFSRSFDDIVRSTQPRMAFEMALVRMARRPPLLPLDELLARVGDLERRLASGAPPPATTPPPTTRGGGGRGGAHIGPAAGPSTAPSTLIETGASRTHGALALAPQSTPWSPESPAPSAPHPRAEPIRPAVGPALVSVPTPVAGPASVAAPRERAAPERSAWRAIIERVRSAHPPVASVLEHALPLEVGPRRVLLGFEATASFAHSRANEADARAHLVRAVQEHFGPATEVIIEAAARSPAGVRTIAAIDAENRENDLARARAAVADHPIVREAIRIFDAQMKDVRLPSAEG